MKIVGLRHLWWGVSIGGQHYTGEIVQENGPTVELIRKLSRKEAKQLAEEDESRIWEKETNRFNSLEQLERFAICWCKANLGEEWLLQEYSQYGIYRPIAGKGWIVPRIPILRKYAKLWEGVPDSKRTSEVMKVAYEGWDVILQKPT